MTDHTSAFPLPRELSHVPSEFRGLTKREMIAMHLLSGMCAAPERGVGDDHAVDAAVNLADKLLVRLSQD